VCTAIPILSYPPADAKRGCAGDPAEPLGEQRRRLPVHPGPSLLVRPVHVAPCPCGQDGLLLTGRCHARHCRIGDLNYRNNPALTNPAAATWTHDQKWDAVSALVEAKYAIASLHAQFDAVLPSAVVYYILGLLSPCGLAVPY
jgi:hypothetical protein